MSLEADQSICGLNGAGILLTRPLAQSSLMQALIKKHGGEAYVFPCLEITLCDFDVVRAGLGRVRTGDVLIFVSINAVEGAFQNMDEDLRAQLARVQISAVGERTRAALAAENVLVEVSPEAEQQNTEGLLRHPALQDLTGRRVYIVRGQSGRQLLGDTLINRGAKLEYIQAYTRSIPRGYDRVALLEVFQAGGIQYVMLTSYAVFENLIQMLGSAAESILNSVQLVVPGARVASKIRTEYPFTVRAAKNASDREMLIAVTH